jgi:hypothetical protein
VDKTVWGLGVWSFELENKDKVTNDPMTSD